MDDNFIVRKAYHEKQAAYNEMKDSQAKMLELQTQQAELFYHINDVQAQYDDAKAKQDASWKAYNTEILGIKAEIGKKITSGKEAAKLEEELRQKSENPDEDPAKALIYAKGADFFGKLNLENMTERDALISKKRTMIRPDNSMTYKILTSLKNLRKEHGELLEKYHTAKNDYSLKKTNFDRLEARYLKIKQGDEPSNDDSSMSSRPQKIHDERLLVQAEVPEKYWDSCSMRQRADGKIDIYYGENEATDHGHIVLSGDTIEYARRPKELNVGV